MKEPKETIHEQYPTCPSCGAKDYDWWDGLDGNESDDHQWEWECACGANNVVKKCVSIAFDTVEVE
jgi:hypothetical protein